MSTRLASLALLLLVAAAPAAQAQQSYVLGAQKWSAEHTKAITAAGGTVVFQHPPAGIAVVTSNNPNFLADVTAKAPFAEAILDRVVQWEQPAVVADGIDAASLPPTDTFFSGVQWAPQAIQAPEAWAAGCEGAGVRVAVLDGGIYSSHVDLAGAIDAGASRSFTTGAWNSDIGTFWHGTHVAGIIAAANNGIGTVGIAPRATIIGVKVLHDGSGPFSAIFQGIIYASTPVNLNGAGADILNLSLGSGPFLRAPAWGEFRSVLNRVMQYANKQGALVVVSAGNDAFDFDHSGNATVIPAEAPNVVTVSATGPMGWALGAKDFYRPASYTNFGTSVIDVAAPGGDFALPGNASCTKFRSNGTPIVQPCWVFDMVMSPVRGSGTSVSTYSWAAGTSMAAPAAAAVAAIIKGANPTISVASLRTRLMQTATDQGKPGVDPYYGKGWVNALKGCQK
jgi:subtilisin family serine protease